MAGCRGGYGRDIGVMFLALVLRLVFGHFSDWAYYAVCLWRWIGFVKLVDQHLLMICEIGWSRFINENYI